jgi:hypothetical protein
MIDPMGREALFENVLVEGGSKLSPLEEFAEAHALGIKIANCFTGIAIALSDSSRTTATRVVGDMRAR